MDVTYERRLSAKQDAVLARALNAQARGESYEISGFDGEHVTARSLEKRGLVRLVPVDRQGARFWKVVARAG